MAWLSWPVNIFSAIVVDMWSGSLPKTECWRVSISKNTPGVLFGLHFHIIFTFQILSSSTKNCSTSMSTVIHQSVPSQTQNGFYHESAFCLYIKSFSFGEHFSQFFWFIRLESQQNSSIWKNRWVSQMSGIALNRCNQKCAIRVFGSSVIDIKGSPTAINKRALHIDRSARKSKWR